MSRNISNTPVSAYAIRKAKKQEREALAAYIKARHDFTSHPARRTDNRERAYYRDKQYRAIADDAYETRDEWMRQRNRVAGMLRKNERLGA